MTDTIAPTPAPIPEQVQRNTRNIGRLTLGGSTVLSVTGAVPFIDWLFTLAISNPEHRPSLAVVSFVAGVVVAGVNLGIQLLLRGRKAVVELLEVE